MGKFLRVILLLVVIAVAGMGYMQWRTYAKKKELRSDALIYFKEEDYKKSIDYLEKALALKTIFGLNIDQDMECYLAESCFRMEDYERAEELYHKLQKKDSGNSLYYLLEGQCCTSYGDYEKAMQIFKKGWEKTKDPAFISEICEIYIEQNEYDKALSYARQGLGKDGTADAELMYDLIIIYEKSQDYEAAYQAALDYCEKYPEDERGKKELVFLSSRI
jgi:tetratricopeptide (TPR) repeat protein